MRSCAEFSAPCSCLTVVAAEATWTEAGMAPGPAVTAVPTPGSVFTVVAAEHESISFMNLPLILDFSLRSCI